MKNEKRFSKRGMIIPRDKIGNLRNVLLGIFIIFCIIVVIYNIYFESGTPNETEEAKELLELSGEPSPIYILKNNTNYLTNPSITMNHYNQYLIAFEKVINGSSNIWLSESTDGRNWTSEWVFNNNLINATNPRLEYFQENEFALYYDMNGTRYIQITQNGSTLEWGTPEPWEYEVEDKSVYSADKYKLVANETGFWSSDINGDFNWQLLWIDNFSSPAILKVNDYQFLVIHENPEGNFTSITLTIVDFAEPETDETELKWDLMILFIILGVILLGIIVQEVARE